MVGSDVKKSVEIISCLVLKSISQSLNLAKYYTAKKTDYFFWGKIGRRMSC